jgi:hypothetical protein
VLVVFSQGLSPNARLALDDPEVATTRWLVTSIGYGATPADADRRLDHARSTGVVPIVVPPGDERGMLVRLVGPTVAHLVALRLAGHLGAPSCSASALADAATAYRSQPQPAWPKGSAIALGGVSAEEAHGHRWKVLETLLEGDPPLWDVVGAAHGPLQTMHSMPRAIVSLERPVAAGLVARLDRSLSPAVQRVRLRATRDDALAVLELAAQLDQALLAALRERPRDLFDWAGRGAEAPLYDLATVRQARETPPNPTRDR